MGRIPDRAVAAALALTLSGACVAQTSAGRYPDRPLRIIVPLVVGGPGDIQDRKSTRLNSSHT